MKQVVIGIDVSKKTLQVALLFPESKPKQKCFDNQIEGRQKLLEWIARQGDQFTATAFTQTLRQADVEISMDGRGRCYDNIFIERLWRSIKYELIYLKAFEDGKHLSREVTAWFHFYNRQGFHQSLNYRTPDEIYYEFQPKEKVMCNSR